MADYSEFPTTPTGWQERQAAEWEAVNPLAVEDPPQQARRSVDLAALIPGIVFVVLAVVLMTGVSLPVGIFAHGGVLWVVVIGLGVGLLIKELRKHRHTR